MYDDGLARIYHGDAHEILPRLFGGAKADLILTDPPYGISAVSRTSGKTGNHGAATARVYRPVIGDDQPMRMAWMRPYAERMIVWGADHAVDLGEFSGARWLAWDKRDGLRSNNFADVELAIDTGGGAARLFRHRQMGMLDAGLGWHRVHPTQKPLRLMRWCIEQVRPKPTLVVDPFMGSGTTLRAASDLGIASVGIEMDMGYCVEAVKRLGQQSMFGGPEPPQPEQLRGWTV